MSEGTALEGAGRVYQLAAHVRAASDRDGAVLLDLRSGRYLALNPVGSLVLEGVQAGLTAEAIHARVAARCAAPLARVTPDADDFLSQLVSKGLVEAAPAEGRASRHEPCSHPAVAPPSPREAGAAPASARLWVAPAYLALVDGALTLLGFGRVHRFLHRLPPGGLPPDAARAQRLARAVDRAAAFYPKRAWCLERSLVTWLLQVVNDDPRVCGHYVVLERC